jgi:hypothetical protein
MPKKKKKPQPKAAPAAMPEQKQSMPKAAAAAAPPPPPEKQPKSPTIIARDRYADSVHFSDGIYTIVDLNEKPRSDVVSFQAAPRKWKALKKEKEAAARAVAWKREKEAKAAAALVAAASKTQERNRTYVTKMLSLPKLVFTDQVEGVRVCLKKRYEVSLVNSVERG